ncbi:MAG: hypothetical protein ACR2MS_05415 [Weeksellaceae bacterium]
MKKSILFACTISLFIISCENKQSIETNNSDLIASQNTEVKENMSSNTEATLNRTAVVNGKEVPINDAMCHHINELKTAVNKLGQPTSINYKNAEKILTEKLNNLMASCTIDGTEGHAILHEYLFPIKENIESLSVGKEDNFKVIMENLSVIKCDH